jgi:tetratricopeptide (TPR) repeat protein
VRSLLAEYPRVATVHALNGSLHVARKDLRRARAEYEQALRLDPRSFEAMSGIVGIDLAGKRVSEARAFVDTQLAADPQRPEVMVLAARVYGAGEDWPGAEGLLKRAIALDPGNMSAYGMLGQVYFAQRKLDEAVAELDGIVRRNPNDVAAATMAAMLVESQRKLPDAKKRYIDIVARDPRAAIASNNLAWLYAEERANLDEALRLAQTAVSVRPDDANMHDTLGWVYYRRDLPDLAIGPFEQSIAKDPANPTFHYHLALALTESGETERARNAAQAALNLRPDYDEARRLLDTLK